MRARRLDCMFPLGHPHLVMEIVIIINEPKVKSRSPMTIGSLDPIKTLNQLAQLSNSLLYIQKHLILLILLKLLQYRVLTITIPPQYKRNRKQYNLISEFQILMPLQRLDNQLRYARLIQKLLRRDYRSLVLLPV